jgi:hypothetical protein
MGRSGQGINKRQEPKDTFVRTTVNRRRILFPGC